MDLRSASEVVERDIPSRSRSQSPTKRCKTITSDHMAAAPEQFRGFVVSDTHNITFHMGKFTPKTFEDHDVDIENECCGVCNCDVRTISGCFRNLDNKPLCVGHEIIGKVLRVGPKVQGIKPGDRVGVGAQAQSCMECKNCLSDNENYCPRRIATYNDIYALDEGHSNKPMNDKNGRKIFSQGGLSSHSRVHEQFVFPIPGNIPSHEAAPMMCAGLTTYSPLVRASCGPGKKVAIVGIGGFGHFGVIWAKALGAEVWALSHTPTKEAEAKKLGADNFVCTRDNNWAKPLASTFDFILNTAGMITKSTVKEYMSTLAVNGTLHTVGTPDRPLPHFTVQDFSLNGSNIGGSHAGSKQEALAMLKLASEKNLHPMVETIDISEAGCMRATQMIKSREVRYCVTLINFNIAFAPASSL